MPSWLERPPKGVKCRKKQWVTYENGSFIAGTVEGWGEEEVYLLSTVRGDKPLLMALTLDEAAAICHVLSTSLMVALWEKAGKEHEAEEH